MRQSLTETADKPRREIEGQVEQDLHYPFVNSATRFATARQYTGTRLLGFTTVPADRRTCRSEPAVPPREIRLLLEKRF